MLNLALGIGQNCSDMLSGAEYWKKQLSIVSNEESHHCAAEKIVGHLFPTLPDPMD